MKGRPHGVVAGTADRIESRRQVVIEEVQGIPYYVDAEASVDSNNIAGSARRAYDPAAVVDNVSDPKVVGHVCDRPDGRVFQPLLC